MIKQSILSFKLETTHDLITSHAGLILLGEFAIGTGIKRYLDKDLPGPGSGAGYKVSEHIFPLIIMLNGGGRALEDIREIRRDTGLRELLELNEIPSTDATGKWLHRAGENGALEGLAKVNRRLLKKALKKDKHTGYTLDIDATGIEAHKQEAKMTYKGYKGYMPIVGHLAENGLIVGEEFREGNESPASRNLEFLKYCEEQLPKGKQIKAFRADSASYQAKIINYCQSKGIKFAIGADMDKAVVEAIKGIKNWRPYQNGYIGDTIHCMNKTDQAFRLIVIRRPYQGKLIGKEDLSEKYIAIASNKEDRAEDVIRWYNQRGEYSENRIKELKIGFGMERMPCGKFKANSVFFRIGILAYNIGRLFVLKGLDQSWHCHQVHTLRWKLYGIAAKIVYHGRYVYLKVSHHIKELFSRIRFRSWQFAQT